MTPGQLKTALQSTMGVVVKKDKKSAMRRQILKMAYASSSAHSHAWDKVVARNLTKAVLLDISSHSERGSWIDDTLRPAQHQLPASNPSSDSEVGQLMHQPEQEGPGQRDEGGQLENAGAKASITEGKQKAQKEKQWHHCQRLSVY